MVACPSRRCRGVTGPRTPGVHYRRLVFEVLEQRGMLSGASPLDPLGGDLGLVDLPGASSEPVPALLGSAQYSDSPIDPPPIINHQVTSDPGVQQMPSIAVDPLDSKHLVLAYMDYSLVTADAGLPGEGYAGIGVAVSHDAGDHWQKTSIPLPAGFDQGAANPIVRFGVPPDEHAPEPVFVSFMAATFLSQKPPLTNPNYSQNPDVSDRTLGFQANNGVFVGRSDDGGLTWDQPVAVVSHQYNGQDPVFFEVIPDLAVDTFPTLVTGQHNVNHGNLYVAWTRLYPTGEFPGHPGYQGGADIMIAVSKDGGRSWETKVQSQDGMAISVIQDPTNHDTPPGLGGVDQAQVAIGTQGEIYLSEFGSGTFAVHVSRDGGVTFAPPDPATGQRIALGWGPSNIFVTESGLPNNRFRTQPTRPMAADPVRQGQVYGAAVAYVSDASGKTIDAADVFFARSNDYGDTWHRDFTLAGTAATVLNDENGGKSATGSSSDEVIAGQAMPRLTVDAQGNIGVIWYDTRRDPADHLLDVFGTISTDGGQTFSPNFRITDASFDADRGAFTDAAGKTDYYLGDFLGLAMADNTAYAAWSDTRNGNQDVYFARYSIEPAPAPLNDRFEPNQSFGTATDLGRVVQRVVPKLALPPGDEDWFAVEASASGDLIVSAAFSVPLPASAAPQVQLWDSAGTTLVATGKPLQDDTGHVLGSEIRYPAESGQRFLVRVLGSEPSSGNAGSISYSLRLQSLTADLGTRVTAEVSGSIHPGGAALYRLTAAASGSLEVQLHSGADVQGALSLQVLDGETLVPLQAGQPGRSLLASSVEPDDSIAQANQTGLTGLGSVTLDGSIGDGPFGGTSGDYDFYRFEAEPGQKIVVTLSPDIVGRKQDSLDSMLFLYDNLGNRVVWQDNGSNGDPETFTYLPQAAGIYDLAVAGYGSDAPGDPFTAGTGKGVGSTGEYRVTITIEAPGRALVEQGQSVLLLVTGDGQSSGDFSLDATNLDQFAANTRTLPLADGAGPSSVVMEDFNGDGKPDLAVSNTLSNTVSLFLGNGDGTFQAARQLSIGAFPLWARDVLFQKLPSYGRGIATADVNGDGMPDLVVTNYGSADVSVLLGRGDGTFQPQRRFDATGAPIALALGDLNGDHVTDLVTTDAPAGLEFNVAALLGRSDGTFQPQHVLVLPSGGGYPPSDICLADFNGDGKDDIAVNAHNRPGVIVLLGNGDGSFQPGSIYDPDEESYVLAVGDVNGDGIPDIVSGVAGTEVRVLLGKGDGTFRTLGGFFAGQGPANIVVVDYGSQAVQADGSIALGPPDGRPDLVIADTGNAFAASAVGPPEVVLLPNLGFDAHGNFLGFGPPIPLAYAKSPQRLAVGDVNRDGTLDIAAVDRDGILVIFGKTPTIVRNDTSQTARDLGTVVHLVQPTLTLVPGHEDAYYRLTVPTEAVAGAGDEVIDLSGLFVDTEGAGLGMEVRDGNGNLLGSGARFRVQAAQGRELLLHVFGVEDGQGSRGAGAYTLVIDALPQVVSVEAQALLPGQGGRPGGPTTSIVITLQGDRLDAATAEDPGNYTVTFVGPDGVAGTADDQVVPVHSVVYDPGANVEVSSGRTYPTAVRQTVTLAFDQPLPAGSYSVELSPRIQTAPFSEAEGGLLADPTHFAGHPVVSDVAGRIAEGVRVQAVDLVMESGSLGDLDVFYEGTPFLTQLQNDLGARLDSLLTAMGDAPGVSDAILSDILNRVAPGLGRPGQRPTSILVIFLDPMAFGVADANNRRVAYDLQTNTPVNQIPATFVEVGGNVEVVTVADAAGSYRLNLANVPQNARGGAVLLGAAGDKVISLTSAIRDGQRSFVFSMDTAQPSPSSVSGPAAAAAMFASPLQAVTNLVVAPPPPALASPSGNSAAAGQTAATVPVPSSTDSFVGNGSGRSTILPPPPSDGGLLGLLRKVWSRLSALLASLLRLLPLNGS